MQDGFDRANGADGFTNCSLAAIKAARRVIRPFSRATMMDVVVRSPTEQLATLSGLRAYQSSPLAVITIPTELHQATPRAQRALLFADRRFVEKDAFHQDARPRHTPLPNGRAKRSLAMSWWQDSEAPHARRQRLADPARRSLRATAHDAQTGCRPWSRPRVTKSTKTKRISPRSTASYFRATPPALSREQLGVHSGPIKPEFNPFMASRHGPEVHYA
ncbi:hypothetical protein ACVWY2_008886 [Bradyrhizobium sp. JR6.1]